MHSDNMQVARKLLFSGIVRGVGFRYFAQRSAATHQIRGYIKNLDDGRVEALVEGGEKAVEAFKQDLTAGPRGAVVENIEETVLEPESNYSSFLIEK